MVLANAELFPALRGVNRLDLARRCGKVACSSARAG